MGEGMGKMRKFKLSDNLLWILFFMLILMVLLLSYAEYGLYLIIDILGLNISPAVTFINESYTLFLADVIVLVIVCLVVKKNRFILRSFLPKGKGKDHKLLVIEDSYEPSQENTVRNLLIGLLLGFLSNFVCVLCAILHADIKLYPDFSIGMIPTLLYALLMVFIQSSSEELWCRGFMYERICIHYPLWVAVLVNGVFFGLLHIFNNGVTVLSIVSIVICGFSYSLLRWYTGSIWTVMGIHTMWNFTQNFIFGLPNSGLVSEVSIFRMDAVNGVSNLIYDYGFGVEGAIPAVVADSLLGIVCLILAKKTGRLGELRLSYEKKAASSGQEKPLDSSPCQLVRGNASSP